jgi:hypothetical protein
MKSKMTEWRDYQRRSTIVQFEITDYDLIMAPTYEDKLIEKAFQDCRRTLGFLLGEEFRQKEPSPLLEGLHD